ncbi:MAG: nucleotide exchange factor GrpE [Halanaerobium sp.]|nr:nucleotide exchange factor GrpE [Halanaerobium sp.]
MGFQVNDENNLQQEEAGLDKAGPNDVQPEDDVKEEPEGIRPDGNEAGSDRESNEEATCEVLQEKVANLESRLHQLEEENGKYLFRLQRLQADFANYRKRVQREKSNLEEMALEEFILKLLPVLDNLERALLAAGPAADNQQGIIKGVEMVYSQLLRELEKEGLERIAAEGEEFDPSFHEAVMKVQAEGRDENEIVEEMQAGYKLKGKVIRPAMVKVAE